MDRSVDFFVSYTGADTAWAEWISWQLEAAGHQTIMQAWDFHPGENFVVAMRRALESADRTLAVVSAAYLQSVYGSDEWTAAFIHDRPGTSSLLVVRVEEVTLPRLLRPWIYIDLAGLNAETAAQRLRDGVQSRRRKPDRPPAFPPAMSDPGRPRFPGRGLMISNLPPRNPAFTGRDDLLAELRIHLGRSTDRDGPVTVVAQALYGLGGVGKTQLALEYAHRYATGYDLAWWVPAENPLTIPANIARLAPKLGIQIIADQEEVVAAVLDELRAHERWLLIFDNAEQPEDLAPWQPTGNRGHVLVTSRNPAWGALGRAIRVDVLPREQAVAFLLRRSRDHDPSNAGELAAELGDLPLALEQAAAYLEQTGMPVSAYLAIYRRRREELLTKGRAVAYQGQVDTTWQLSIDRVSPAGIELLRLCAFLAPEGIPMDLVTAEPHLLPGALADAVTTDTDAGVHEAAGSCYRYSLLDHHRTEIRVHRMVQAVVRAQLAEPDRHSTITAAVKLLASAYPSNDELANPKRWPRCAQLLPHLLAATEHAQEAQVAGATTAELLRRAGVYLGGIGDYLSARHVLDRALALAEAVHGPNKLDVSKIHDQLGRVLLEQKDLVGARWHLERAAAIKRSVLGHNHSELAYSLDYLGRVLLEQGDLADARANLERALTIGEATLGSEHPQVGNTLGKFGVVLRAQGDLVRARMHLERALAIKRATLDPDHPEIGNTLDQLGRVLREQGDLAGARGHLEPALVIKRAALGPDHPEVAYTSNNLGRLLHLQGDLVGAREYLERAVAVLQTAFGPNHPEVAVTRGHLGGVLRDQGDLAGARENLKCALFILQTTLGSEHPDTRAVAGQLASL